MAAVKTDAQRGLTEGEARSRLAQHGRNELIEEAAIPAWRRFLAQFKDVLVILLLVATAISLALWLIERGEAGASTLPYEAIAILAIVLLNAVMGHVQESRAESAVAAIRAMSADNVSVIRDGKHVQIPAAELVTGDLILIEEGDAIAADARLIHSTALQVAEAALTGESLPVTKDTDAIAVAPDASPPGLGDRTNMIFSGTAATYGRGRAVVTATGMRTEIGRIAGMLEHVGGAAESTPLQVELNRVGRMLGSVVIVIAVVMIITIILVERVRGFAALFDALILGVALAVAAVPEGLPAIVTAVLALGVQRMARRKAIVRHLAAVETLGSVTTIASDKTGTLTKNEMTVRVAITASGRATFEGTGYTPHGGMHLERGDATEIALREELRRALTVADLANNARLLHENGTWTVQGDPTEVALLVAARKAGLTGEALDARFERIGEVPFSSERKLMSTVVKDADRRGASGGERVLAFTKGAPDVLVARCTHEFIGSAAEGGGHAARPLTDERRAQIMHSNEELAGQALRTLAVAYRTLPSETVAAVRKEAAQEELERELVFLGLIGMIDPPRDEAKDAVAKARGAGIRPMMITGDHPKTAAVIARELGIASAEADDETRAITGRDLQRMSDDELHRTVHEVSVYARVDPEHKLRIVKALQRGGQTVAMTGDGVNDAPALKAADVGVAMGITGTDVSKQAADIVLVDDNFATIVAAVEEGRGIFDNIRKFLRYLLSSNIGEVMTMFFGVLLARVIGLHQDGDSTASEAAGTANTFVLPLLATQILWINLVTDGAPALALGIDPAEEGLMDRPPRPRDEGVLTGRMWRGILFVGAIMALGTLAVLDASLPGGLIEGDDAGGGLRYAQTMAFTTLVMFQLFNVFNARSDEFSAFRGMFRNKWLWAAVALSLLLHVAVIYVPFLQSAFSTSSLTLLDWLKCAVAASSVLWLREVSKLIARRVRHAPRQPEMPTPPL